MTKRTDLYILIAEDDEDDREVMQESFVKHPHFSKVDVVNHGKELLDFLNEATHLPDVILTDINMPIMDGITALTEIYNNKGLDGIQTFVYSTSINPAYEARCHELGIRAYLVKPYDLDGFDEIPTQIIDALA